MSATADQAERRGNGAADTPGSLDLCFIVATSSEEVTSHLRACGVEIIDGPVRRIGALGDVGLLPQPGR